MDDVARLHGIAHRPSGVIQILEIVVNLSLDRPLAARVEPAIFYADGGFAVAIHHRRMAQLLQAFRQVGDEQLGAAIFFGWNRDEWRRDQRNSHDSPAAACVPAF